MLLLPLLLILITIALITQISPNASAAALQYRIKFTTYVLYVSCVTGVGLPLFWWRGRSVANTRATVPFVRFASPMLGITWEMSGEEELRGRGPYVIICNHQSVLDVLGMAVIWPYIQFGCAVVAKKQILFVPPFGPAAYFCGTVFIDRTSPSAAKEKMNAECRRLKADGVSLWLFPEGTRGKGRSLLPFKKGAFVLAKENGLPLLPVVMSPYTFIDDERKVFGAGKMLLSILPPITLHPTSQLDHVIQTTWGIMEREFKILTAKAHLINGLG